MRQPQTEQHEERVLILAPTGRDAELACTVLSQAGILAQACRGMEELCREIEAGAGAALLVEEALEGPAALFFETLDRQPPWSDLPVILFAGGESNADVLLETVGPRANVTILERPIRITTVVSALRAALRVRRRQYQARDLLRQLEESDRQKDMFLAMLGHELRNPLNAISNAVQVLNQISSQDDQPVRLREIIARQVRQLSRLVDDMLDVSRITSGKITLRREPVDLNEVAERCLQSLRLNEGPQRQSLSLTVEAGPVMVEGDPARLEQIISNLLSNAIKYTPPDGRIRLSVAREREEAVIRVEDTGVGIAPEMLSAIFGIFTQVEGTLDRSQGGLGLGLSLVRRLAEKHGGSVVASSPGLGQGSEFTVRLPLYYGPLPSRQSERAQPAVRPRHILIVEDSEEGRESLRLLLEIEGHRVDVAEDGQQGVEMALELKPEIALVDIGLPVLDGFEVAQKVRAAPEGGGIFMIALSGYGQPEDRKLAMEAGFSAHLVKPLDFDKLTQLLSHIPSVQVS